MIAGRIALDHLAGDNRRPLALRLLERRIDLSAVDPLEPAVGPLLPFEGEETASL